MPAIGPRLFIAQHTPPQIWYLKLELGYINTGFHLPGRPIDIFLVLEIQGGFFHLDKSLAKVLALKTL
jgi:hypothetical protein